MLIGGRTKKRRKYKEEDDGEGDDMPYEMDLEDPSTTEDNGSERLVLQKVYRAGVRPMSEDDLVVVPDAIPVLLNADAMLVQEPLNLIVGDKAERNQAIFKFIYKCMHSKVDKGSHIMLGIRTPMEANALIVYNPHVDYSDMVQRHNEYAVPLVPRGVWHTNQIPNNALLYAIELAAMDPRILLQIMSDRSWHGLMSRDFKALFPEQEISKRLMKLIYPDLTTDWKLGDRVPFIISWLKVIHPLAWRNMAFVEQVLSASLYKPLRFANYGWYGIAKASGAIAEDTPYNRLVDYPVLVADFCTWEVTYILAIDPNVPYLDHMDITWKEKTIGKNVNLARVKVKLPWWMAQFVMAVIRVYPRMYPKYKDAFVTILEEVIDNTPATVTCMDRTSTLSYQDLMFGAGECVPDIYGNSIYHTLVGPLATPGRDLYSYLQFASNMRRTLVENGVPEDRAMQRAGRVVIYRKVEFRALRRLMVRLPPGIEMVNPGVPVYNTDDYMPYPVMNSWLHRAWPPSLRMANDGRVVPIGSLRVVKYGPGYNYEHTVEVERVPSAQELVDAVFADAPHDRERTYYVEFVNQSVADDRGLVWVDFTRNSMRFISDYIPITALREMAISYTLLKVLFEYGAYHIDARELSKNGHRLSAKYTRSGENPRMMVIDMLELPYIAPDAKVEFKNGWKGPHIKSKEEREKLYKRIMHRRSVAITNSRAMAGGNLPSLRVVLKRPRDPADNSSEEKDDVLATPTEQMDESDEDGSLYYEEDFL
jgi:hypothetical protein